MIVTRFPPSPTGYLHVGSLRTALYNYLYARKHGGKFLLRIEDTDRERYVEGAVESMVRTLGRFGLDYDEGPMMQNGELTQVGPNGPYVQSERLEIYREHVDKLVAQGTAYLCFCSKERLDEVRNQQRAAKLTPKYDRACCKLTEEEVKTKLEAKESHVIRLKVPKGETPFIDEIRGRIVIQNKEIDDQVLLKSDGFPTYHLAVVVDDHFMEVSHVIRGEEWLSSTPKHVMLYEAFGWEVPKFAHLPLILNEDRSKLSKRQGDVAAEAFLEKGYLPEALINFVALLGFNPKGDQEIYELKELIESFDLKKVNKGGAVFNREKLDWMNAEYLRTKNPAELAKLATPFLLEAGKEVEETLLEKICAVEVSRLNTLGGLVDLVDGYIGDLSYEGEILVWKKTDAAGSKDELERLRTFIEQLDETFFETDVLVEQAVKEYIGSNDLQNGNVLWPMRVALSGRKASPSPFELVWVLGQKKTILRLTQAIDRLTA